MTSPTFLHCVASNIDHLPGPQGHGIGEGDQRKELDPCHLAVPQRLQGLESWPQEATH